MQITTTARHFDLDPELRRFVEQRVGKFRRYAGDILEAHVVLSAEKYRHSAEITVHLRQNQIVGRDEATDARMAIDRAAGALEEQLRRLKERRIDRTHEARGSARVVNGRTAPSPPDEEATGLED
jgi:putative sigma-54 modulation protein